MRIKPKWLSKVFAFYSYLHSSSHFPSFHTSPESLSHPSSLFHSTQVLLRPLLFLFWSQRL